MSLYSEYYLAHYGVKGMKWGVRKYQNEDGTLTDAGKKRFARSVKKSSKNILGPRRMTKITRDIADELNRQPSMKDKLKKVQDFSDKAIKSGSDDDFLAYQREVSRFADSLVGRYGDKKIKTFYGMPIVSTGRLLVENAIYEATGWQSA